MVRIEHPDAGLHRPLRPARLLGLTLSLLFGAHSVLAQAAAVQPAAAPVGAAPEATRVEQAQATPPPAAAAPATSTSRYAPLSAAPWRQPAPVAPAVAEAAVAIPYALEAGVRLGFAIGLLRYGAVSVGSGPNEIEESVLSWGFPSVPIFFELGYAATERVVLGLQFTLSGEARSAHAGTKDTERSGVEVGVGPTFDFMLVPNSQWNPFVGGQVHFARGSTSGSSMATVATSLFRGALRVGLHYFAAQNVSLDPTLSFGMVSGSQIVETSAGQGSVVLDGVELGAALGLSAWFK